MACFSPTVLMKAMFPSGSGWPLYLTSPETFPTPPPRPHPATARRNADTARKGRQLRWIVRMFVTSSIRGREGPSPLSCPPPMIGSAQKLPIGSPPLGVHRGHQTFMGSTADVSPRTLPSPRPTFIVPVCEPDASPQSAGLGCNTNLEAAPT